MSNFHASTFRDDGYRDGKAGECSPPDVSVYAAEYMEGYREAVAPIAQCLNDLDTILEAHNGDGLHPGVIIAYWSHSWADGGKPEPIILDGRFNSRGGWGMQGIRWHCPARGNKGLFGKGLALYGKQLPAWADALPRVK